MRRIIVAIVAVLLWIALVVVIKVDNINAEYERNVREHPPGAPAAVMH